MRLTLYVAAGAVHMMTAITMVALIEVAKAETRILSKYPQASDNEDEEESSTIVYYGISYLLAWVVFIVYFSTSIAFFTNSKKRKMLPFDHEQRLR